MLQQATAPQPSKPTEENTANSVPQGRRITLSLPLPQRVSLTGATAVTGSSILAGTIASGNAPTEPVYVYSLVALSIASMAYDIARKALRLREG
ncbi:hypothetical protein [Streptomyces sp. NPDC057939]|uniref:hypothetical protein n=1 Tax=Streptomyces sp. NPDC057939 TaxID=3346284 RepID=UPI0036EBAD38